VSVGKAGEERQITNVAAGTTDTDAVNFAQLREAGLIDEDGNPVQAVTYDDADKDRITLDGAAGTTLANVKAGAIGAGSLEAVNGSQLFATNRNLVNALGGGATLDAFGGIVGPSYNIMGTAFGNVGQALEALDRGLLELDGRVDALESAAGTNASTVAAASEASTATPASGATDAPAAPSNDAVPIVAGSAAGDTAGAGTTPVAIAGNTTVGTGAVIGADATAAVAVGEGSSVQAASGTAIGQGAQVQAGATGAVALGQGSVADRANSVSVGSTGNERQVVNVADGTEATDAANVRQVQAGDAATLTQSKAYTDARFEEVLAAPMAAIDDLRGEMGSRLREQDQRIDKMGAMNAAMLNMATSAAGIRTPNRMAVGVGWSGSEQALSVGYQRAFSDRMTMTVGGAFSDDESSAGVGVGFGW
jgi:autotransporter adhesin